MNSRLTLTGTLLILVACGSGSAPLPPPSATPAAPADQQPARNHYKGWNVHASIVDADVWLKERPADPPWKATLHEALKVFNPAKKVHNGAPHGEGCDCLHYVAYWIDPIPPRTKITFHDQFTQPGVTTWRFNRDKPSWLLVPASKRHKEQKAEVPKGDHLLCYAVHMAEPPEGPVTATDQFSGDPAPTIDRLEPSHFCFPMFRTKENGEVISGVDHPQSYLAIYRYRLDPLEKYDDSVWTSDAVAAAQKLDVTFSEFLAVPAWQGDQ